ncbi:glycosyltransferase family 2 protein [Ascidiimonas sp. W6]|uniref:glycosyltransferase family 2 protein n=1 Tax=Ascidiimonas meishanensis TaxID=3128903 RepID=UPI0030ECE919
MNYYVIIPAHNEEAFLKKTLESLLKQVLLPGKVIIVNDHSTDGTEAIIDSYTTKHNFIFKHNILSSETHMPGSKVVNAFNKGLTLIDADYDFIVKLDADLILPPNYFSELTKIFQEHPKVGIAGGFAYECEDDGKWMLNHTMSTDHVRGAFKAYRKECFQKIGGLKASIGWDTVDELLARFYEFEIFTDQKLKVKHLRPTGTSYNKKARYLQGEAMYKMRYGFTICLIASIKMALVQKKFRSLPDNIIGYLKAWISKKPFMVTSEEGKFIRTYRTKGILQKLKLI